VPVVLSYLLHIRLLFHEAVLKAAHFRLMFHIAANCTLLGAYSCSFIALFSSFLLETARLHIARFEPYAEQF
jgi:hypothetical protein